MDITNDRTVTKLLTLWTAGQPQAIGRLVEAVYGDLLRIAHRQMRGERRGHTLQTAALVHEAYLASWNCAGSIGGTAVISLPWRPR
ncbi:MAG: ECF-type sigma factor [Gammaproteobacteria bacterium]